MLNRDRDMSILVRPSMSGRSADPQRRVGARKDHEGVAGGRVIGEDFVNQTYEPLWKTEPIIPFPRGGSRQFETMMGNGISAMRSRVVVAGR